MTDTRTEAGICKISLEHFVVLRVRIYSKSQNVGAWQKDMGINWKELPVAKAGQI